MLSRMDSAVTIPNPSPHTRFENDRREIWPRMNLAISAVSLVIVIFTANGDYNFRPKLSSLESYGLFYGASGGRGDLGLMAEAFHQGDARENNAHSRKLA